MILCTHINLQKMSETLDVPPNGNTGSVEVVPPLVIQAPEGTTATTNHYLSPVGKLNWRESIKNLRDNAVVASGLILGSLTPIAADFISQAFQIAQNTDFGQYTPYTAIAFTILAPWVNRVLNIMRVK